MEMSCDERVLKEIGNELNGIETKKAYSLSLVSLATERKFIGVTPLAFGEGNIKGRVKNVMRFKKTSRVLVALAAVAAVSLSVLLLINQTAARDEGGAQGAGIDVRFQAAVDFLAEMPSLFKSFDWLSANINSLEKAFPMFYMEQFVAIDFWMYDLDGDGIPEIVVEYGVMESGRHGPWVVFQYIDGEYQLVVGNMAILTPWLWSYNVSVLPAQPKFFRDENGQTVLFMNSEMQGVAGYWGVELNNGVMRFEPLVVQEGHVGDETMGFSEWQDYVNHGLIIPNRPDSRLTPIHLYDVRLDVRVAVTQKLGIPPTTADDGLYAIHELSGFPLTLNQGQNETRININLLLYRGITDEEIRQFNELVFQLNRTESALQDSVIRAALGIGYVELTAHDGINRLKDAIVQNLAELYQTDIIRDVNITDFIVGGQNQQGLTVEQLGAAIVAAGEFWEEWWEMRGRFSSEHFEPVSVEDRLRIPNHPAHNGLEPFYDPNGFRSLNDIRTHMLQWYTEAWVDAELFGDFPVFIEYEGRLYVHNARAGFPRPNWATATHVLVEQGVNLAIVETTLLEGSWHRGVDDAYPTEVVRQFVFVGGRIDRVAG
jgi:hypothetical protein